MSHKIAPFVNTWLTLNKRQLVDYSPQPPTRFSQTQTSQEDMRQSRSAHVSNQARISSDLQTLK